jgi:transposase
MPVPKHSKELKLKVIQAYLDGSKGYKILSQEFDVDLQTIRLWIEKYKAQGEDGLNVKLKRLIILQNLKSRLYKCFLIRYRKRG